MIPNCDIYSQLIENQQKINITQNNLIDTNQKLLITINKNLNPPNLITEFRVKVITEEQNDAKYTMNLYKEIVSDNQQLISRNQRMIETNELFITNKELLFSSNQEIANLSKDLFLENQNITLNNFELISRNHSLIAKHLHPPIIFPEIPKSSWEAINSTRERIVISSQLIILSRISQKLGT